MLRSLIVSAAIGIYISLSGLQAQECGEPQNCVVSEWNNWSECTETCGESGTRTRTRVVFQVESCGGSCPFDVREAEPCNRFCCPKDCTFTNWGLWTLCYCTDSECFGDGKRNKCKRMREKLSNASCGGYCDEETTQEWCGVLCCYRDCVLSRWSLWSFCDAPCEQTGMQTRKRYVTQEPVCGGQSCGPLEEYRKCVSECCPVHCVLGEWGAWSTCNTTCGEAMQTRRRFVQLPECNGHPCLEDPTETETRKCSSYVNVDCEVSSWSTWTNCYLDNGYCGKGSKYRSRRIITEPMCEGTLCANLTETGECSGPCCRKDCEVSAWTEWAHCSSSCGQGVSNRTRSVISWPLCDGSPCPSTMLESRSCVVTDVISCEFTDWSNWTACSNDCGEGVVIRSRSMITPAYCGGSCENELTYEERVCESYTAMQDCEVSVWSEWSQCERTCEGGIERRNRTIISNPVCGGIKCPNVTERRSCHELCEQLCTAGKCRCQLGYRLDSNNITCSEVTCPSPRVEYCPSTHKYPKDCRYPSFDCLRYMKYNDTCYPHCLTGWKLTGTPQFVTCRKDGSWSQPLLYCARPNDAPTGIILDNTKIEENTPKDACIGYLSTTTTIRDFYETHTYDVTDAVTGRLYTKLNRVCLTRLANYEEKPTKWNATIHSYDIDGQSVNVTFEFEILNANDPPTSVKLEPNTLPENSPNGTVVGCFVGTDDEVGQTITFNMIDSDRHTFVTYDDDDGNTCLKVIKDSDPRCYTEGGKYCELNIEIKPIHHVTVVATDDGNPPMSTVFDVPIHLSDVNDRQTAVMIRPDSLPENIEPGESLVQLIAIDEDVNQNYSFRLVQDSGGIFQVKGTNLTATKSFDFEKDFDSYDIEVEATDLNEPSFVVSSKIKMYIQDKHEPPYSLQLSSVGGIQPYSLNSPKVQENAQGIIGTISVMDEDFGDVLEISINHNENTINHIELSPTKCSLNVKKINVCTAKVEITSAFNYEEMNSVDLSFTSTDTTGLNNTLDVYLEILDKNDPPKILLFNGNDHGDLTVEENKRDHVVVELSVVDEDSDDHHEFEIMDSGTGSFVIVGNNLKTAPMANIDFEKQEEYQMTIRVTDSGSPQQVADFNVTVSVIDVNERPTETILTSSNISEHSLYGSKVGDLFTTDPDNSATPDRQQFLYSLSDNSFGRFSIDGHQLKIKESSQLCGVKFCQLDYETEPTVTIKVVTMDNGVPRTQREDKIVIHITDENDPPTDIRLDFNTIRENMGIGEMIGTLSSYDEDVDDIVTYSLSDFTDSFEIRQKNQLFALVSFDYEMLNSYWLTVVARDNGIPPSESRETIIIRVINVNEEPVFTSFTRTLIIRDDAMVNKSIASFVVSDPDRNDDIDVNLNDPTETFALSSPSCSIVLRTGATECLVDIILFEEVDVEKQDKYDIVITIADKHGLGTNEMVTITIEDVNNSPSDILLDGVSAEELNIPENSQGTVVSNLSPVDKDTGQTHTFELLKNPENYFEVDGTVLKIASDAAIDFEVTLDVLMLQLSVQDSGTPPLAYTKNISVYITDVNEAPSAIQLSPDTVMENSVSGTVIGNVTVSDPDVNQTHIIKLVNDANGIFTLDGNTLKVLDGGENCNMDANNDCRIDFESKSTYVISIKVLDSGSPPQLGVFEVDIKVLDRNEYPRHIRLNGNKLTFGSSQGTPIGLLSVGDEDTSQTHSFTMIGSSSYIAVSEEGQVSVLDSEGLVEGQIIEIKVKASDSSSPALSTQEDVKIIVVGSHIITVLVSPREPGEQYFDGIIVKESTPSGTTVADITLQYPVKDVDINVELLEGQTYISITNVNCSNVQGKTGCEAELQISSELDYETMKHIDVMFQSSTGESKSIDYLRITIMDENEAPMFISFSSETITVRENSRDELLGQFSVLDPDQVDNHTFAVTGTGTEVFVIKEFSKLFSKHDADIDYESTPNLTLTISVIDGGGLSLSKHFGIVVVDVNEAPYDLNISRNEIDEMAVEGTEVGSFEIKDYETDQSFSLELISDPSRAFIVDGSKLLVGHIGPECLAKGGSFCYLDFESNAQHTLAVRVTDDGTPQLSTVFTFPVVISDVNDPPRAIALTATKVLETREKGDIISSVSAIDDDPNQTVSFLMLDNPYVSIEGSSLYLKQKLNFESENTITISILAVDNGTPSRTTTAEFEIAVIDVNESPITIRLVPTEKSLKQYPDNSPVISENVPVLTYIGQIIALDGDLDDLLAIESQSMDVIIRNSECIPISSGTRCTADLRSGRVFDFEEFPSSPLILVATDKDGLKIKSNFTLTIQDVNDPPTNIFLNGKSVTELVLPENSRDMILARLSTEDVEDDQSYVYTLTEKIPFLMISGDEIWVTSAADLDYETKDRHELTIESTDSGQLPESYLLDIVLVITNVNEEPVELYLSSNKLPETADTNYMIGSFIVVDPDNISEPKKQSFTFEITTEDSPFSIHDDKILVRSPKFDYETQNIYDVVVVVIDNGTPNLSATFTTTIEIVDVNEQPNYIGFSGLSIKENTELGTIVGKLEASDPDKGQILVYNIVGTELLSVNGKDVVINGPIDYETKNELTFIAQVRDNGSPSLVLEKEFAVKILDINDAPVSISVLDNNFLTISESTLLGEQVARIKVIDEDINERMELMITSGSDWLELGTLDCSVDSAKTECVADLILKHTVDYESDLKRVDVSFLAKDKGALTLQRNFEFSITNENDPPIDIILDSDIDSVPENTANFVVGTLGTVDHDGDDAHTYIVISPWELFTVIGNKLVTKGLLDYERAISHIVNIRSRDDGNPPQSFTKPFIVNVQDINEAPSDIVILPMQIDSDATVGQVVAEIKITDPDNVGRPDFQSHTCILTPTFHLEFSNLQIQVQEVFPPDLTSYDLTVTCSDSADMPLSLSRDFSISIVENADVPKEIRMLDEAENYEINVEENMSDIIVGQLSVINALTKAVIPVNVVYSILESSSASFSVVNGTVILIAKLDFEQDTHISLHVSATGTDNAGNDISLMGKFSVKVLDVNEAPTSIGISGMRAVSENSEEGTIIGDIITYDAETYQTYKYTLLGVNYGMVATESDNEMIHAFSIDGDMLKVGSANHFINYEISDIITLLMHTQDSGAPAYGVESLVHLIINDENDPPTDITLSNSMVAEDATVESVIGVFSVQDEDVKQNQACELLNLNDVPFKISERTKLSVAYATLDFELKNTYTIEVTCGDTLLDGTRLRFTKAFIINVTNVNEPPFNLTISTSVVEENHLVGQAIGEVKAVDLDSAKISFAIMEVDDWSLFYIEGDSTIVSDTIFDFETSKRFYTVSVRAVDEDGAFAVKSFVFEIIDINEAPEQIILDNLFVLENAGPGSRIGGLATIDPDRDQQFTYSLTEHTDKFIVNGDSLIIGENNLDYETSPVYELTITSTDNGIPSKSVQQVITIEVLDANDPPVAIVTGPIKTVQENSTRSTVLLTFTVDDPDDGQRHSCHVESTNNVVTVISESSTEEDLKLVLTGTLNYEEFSILSMNLSCTDGEFEIMKKLDIPVGDVNEPPTAVLLSGSNTILADSPPDTQIGVLSVYDEDIGQKHSFIINGPNSDIVKISNKNQLILNAAIPNQLLSVLDSSLKFVVTVADNGLPIFTYNQTFTIPITNIVVKDNGLPQIIANNFEINSTFGSGDVVGSIFSNDIIIGPNVRVLLVKNPNDVFIISNKSVLVMANDIDSVTETSFRIEVEVHDTVTLEKESSTIIVFVNKNTDCFDEQCSENESCISLNETYHSCECNSDFNRNDNDICTKSTHCETREKTDKVEICLNGGVCVDDPGGYVCECADGFAGTLCEIEQDLQNVCANNPCSNNGFCIPNGDGTEFSCTCKHGWLGVYCNVSEDDCYDTACFNGGTCIDKHLINVCQCDDDWKGLRCEYHQSICREPQCDGTKTCVGRILSEESFCVTDKYIVKLSYDKQEDIDVDEFQARLVDFILRYGRLATISGSTTHRKGQIDNITYNNDVEIYVVAAETEGNIRSFTLVVMDGDGEPFPRDVVLSVLSMTCKDINSKDLTEELFCPSIMSAARAAGGKPLPTSSSSVGLTAGLIVTFFLLFIISVFVGVFVIKKKLAVNKINPQISQSRDQETGSASGYASMPGVQTQTYQEVTPLPTVKTIHVRPAGLPRNNSRYESTI